MRKRECAHTGDRGLSASSTLSLCLGLILFSGNACVYEKFVLPNSWTFWLSEAHGAGPQMSSGPSLQWLLSSPHAPASCLAGEELAVRGKATGYPLSQAWEAPPRHPPDLSLPSSPNSPASPSSSPCPLRLSYPPSLRSLIEPGFLPQGLCPYCPFCLAHPFSSYFMASAQVLPPWKGYS